MWALWVLHGRCSLFPSGWNTDTEWSSSQDDQRLLVVNQFVCPNKYHHGCKLPAFTNVDIAKSWANCLSLGDGKERHWSSLPQCRSYPTTFYLSKNGCHILSLMQTHSPHHWNNFVIHILPSAVFVVELRYFAERELVPILFSLWKSIGRSLGDDRDSSVSLYLYRIHAQAC